MESVKYKTGYVVYSNNLQTPTRPDMDGWCKDLAVKTRLK